MSPAATKSSDNAADPSSLRSPLSQWSDLIGKAHLADWFAHAIGAGKLTGSLLFVGPHGVGKRSVAMLLARTLLCETRAPADMQPCGSCPACQQVVAQTHPDLITIGKPNDRAFIPLDLLIGPPDARMSEGFCRDIRLRPSRGKRKVAILRDADFLNEEGANCLLKTLEEPPPGSLVILIGTSEQRQLPTIRSRCRVIRFSPPSGPDAADLLRRGHGVTETSDDKIADAVAMSAGDMTVAARLLTDGQDQWQTAFLNLLSQPNLDPVAIAKAITSRVDDAGKEASKRRDALRDVLSMAIQHFRRQLRQTASQATAATVPAGSNLLLSRVDRCVRAIREVDRSANQSTLIECLAGDLAQGRTGDRGAIGS
ncbi:DNA polymerase III subunit [Crateriforma conspicua]|uniref:DNA polymerase III subunit tau n=1 Tax=Crateriforma conspicua TaxID=2527996 RepID=A0A5C5Y5M8_9PLAN|nr:DNA polymerase III subunit delta' [Crateriforma conspicua]TWT69535.1 DNA polymerase III subunit tau [Crateriforma conspicua]